MRCHPCRCTENTFGVWVMATTSHNTHASLLAVLAVKLCVVSGADSNLLTCPPMTTTTMTGLRKSRRFRPHHSPKKIYLNLFETWEVLFVSNAFRTTGHPIRMFTVLSLTLSDTDDASDLPSTTRYIRRTQQKRRALPSMLLLTTVITIIKKK